MWKHYFTTIIIEAVDPASILLYFFILRSLPIEIEIMLVI